MRVNEVEVLGVPDEPHGRRWRKHWRIKEKGGRRSPRLKKEVVKWCATCFCNIWRAVHVDWWALPQVLLVHNRFPKIMSPTSVFFFWVVRTYHQCSTFGDNCSAYIQISMLQLKREKATDGTLESDSEREMPYYPRPWRQKLGVFLGDSSYAGHLQNSLEQKTTGIHTRRLWPILMPIQTAYVSLVGWYLTPKGKTTSFWWRN